jgi:hypothetical protein
VRNRRPSRTVPMTTHVEEPSSSPRTTSMPLTGASPPRIRCWCGRLQLPAVPCVGSTSVR